MAVTNIEPGSASMLTRAIAMDRRITFKDCMRRSAGGDETLNQILQHASPFCQKGLQSFYCERVAGVHDIRRSAPLENFCEARAG
ncbi:oxt, partial [Symbiodinium microadriaticum]